MTSWNGSLLASALALVVAAQGAPPATESDPRPADAQALFARLAAMPGLEASFTEEKELALLAAPLKSSGKLYFLPPGWLTRVVEQPEESRLSITPDELRMEDRDGERVLDLHRDEEVRVFVTSLLRVFAGDRAGLERSYRLAYEPDPADDVHWTLTLTPRGKPLDRMMESLRLFGARSSVERIEVCAPNGDVTTTTVTAADPRRVFTPGEKERLFGIPRAARTEH